MKYFLAILFLLFPPLCFAGQDAQWDRYASTPILSATLDWEQGVVQEPTVIRRSATDWIMVYTGGTWKTGHAVLGWATSTDGITWTKNANPIVGDTYGGENSSWAMHSLLYEDAGVLYIFYSTQNMSLRRVESHDDGDTWTNNVMIKDSTGTKLESVLGYVNCAIVKIGDTYYMLLEHGFTGGGPYWRILLMSSTDLTTWSYVSETPLNDLEISNGVWGGPSLIKVCDKYCLWYHGSAIASALPTDGYYAYSTDLLSWTKESGMMLDRASEINIPESMNPLDQIADPWVVDTDTQAYIYYTRGHNDCEVGDIGLAIYDGTLATLVGEISGCGIENIFCGSGFSIKGGGLN